MMTAMARDPEADGPMTSGMMALIPTAEDAQRYAVASGEDPDHLHLTVLYLGDDVSDWDDDLTDTLTDGLDEYTTGIEPMAGRAFGHAHFNPDGGADGDTTPCATYLVGDMDGLEDLRTWLTQHLADHGVTLPPQRTPYVPHVTAGYNMGPDGLSETGPITFDRLRLAVGDQDLDFPLGQSYQELDDDYAEPDALGMDDTPEVKAMPPARRHALAAAGHTLRKGDENYPVGNLDDLDKAITAWGRAKPGDREMLKRHLASEGRRLKASKDMMARIHGLGAETKAFSPDPRAAKLRNYWAFDPAGTRKWRPGIPGDFKRLRRHLAKYVHNPRILNGLTANIHKLATGTWPGRHAHGKALPDDAPLEPDLFTELDADEQALADGVDEWGAEYATDEDLDPENIDPAGALDDALLVGMTEVKAYLDMTSGVDPLMLDTDRLTLLGDRLTSDDDEDDTWSDVVERDRDYQINAGGELVPDTTAPVEQGYSSRQQDSGRPAEPVALF